MSIVEHVTCALYLIFEKLRDVNITGKCISVSIGMIVNLFRDSTWKKEGMKI